jgi:alpha-soluble NSF attachment protein
MDTDKYLKNGEKEVKKAEKALKGTFFGNIFGSKDEKIDKAQEHYEKAINQYKLGKQWEKCAEIYLECAKLAKANDSSKD